MGKVLSQEVNRGDLAALWSEAISGQSSPPLVGSNPVHHSLQQHWRAKRAVDSKAIGLATPSPEIRWLYMHR